jgi:hypothetical protein
MPVRILISCASVAVAMIANPLAALAGGATPAPIPEPGTLGMFAAGIGAAVVALRFWRR